MASEPDSDGDTGVIGLVSPLAAFMAVAQVLMDIAEAIILRLYRKTNVCGLVGGPCTRHLSTSQNPIVPQSLSIPRFYFLPSFISC